MLSNRAKRTFLSIRNGKITKTNRQTGVVETYDNLEGNFVSIVKRIVNFADGQVQMFDFTIVDGGEQFVISVPAYGSVARGIIMSLANIPNPAAGRIKITTWSKGDYTNTGVYFNGQKISWPEGIEVPKLEEITFKGKVFKDDSARIAFVDDLVAKINAALAEGGQPVDEADPVGDMPDGEEFESAAIRPAI